MDCSPPGSFVHGILQTRILEWVAIPSPGDLPDPGIELRFPVLQADSLPAELPAKPRYVSELPNCQTQLLGYWRQPTTVLETMQEKEIKILTPLFLITDS